MIGLGWDESGLDLVLAVEEGGRRKGSKAEVFDIS